MRDLPAVEVLHRGTSRSQVESEIRGPSHPGDATPGTQHDQPPWPTATAVGHARPHRIVKNRARSRGVTRLRLPRLAEHWADRKDPFRSTSYPKPRVQQEPCSRRHPARGKPSLPARAQPATKPAGGSAGTVRFEGKKRTPADRSRTTEKAPGARRPPGRTTRRCAAQSGHCSVMHKRGSVGRRGSGRRAPGRVGARRRRRPRPGRLCRRGRRPWPVAGRRGRPRRLRGRGACRRWRRSRRALRGAVSRDAGR